MKIRLSHSEVELARRQVMSLKDAAGVRIIVRAGSLWVTRDHDPRDVVLRQGEVFDVVGPAGVVVQALSAARVGLLPPVVAPAARARRRGVFALLLGGSGRATAALAAA